VNGTEALDEILEQLAPTPDEAHLSPDGTTLLARHGRRLSLWSLQPFQRMREWEAGRAVLCADLDAEGRVWTATAGELFRDDERVANLVVAPKKILGGSPWVVLDQGGCARLEGQEIVSDSELEYLSWENSEVLVLWRGASPLLYPLHDDVDANQYLCSRPKPPRDLTLQLLDFQARKQAGAPRSPLRASATTVHRSRAHPEQVRSAFQGGTLAFCDGSTVGWRRDGRWQFQHFRGAAEVFVSPDGRYLLTRVEDGLRCGSGPRGRLHLWDGDTSIELNGTRLVPPGAQPFAPDGSWMVTLEYQLPEGELWLRQRRLPGLEVGAAQSWDSPQLVTLEAHPSGVLLRDRAHGWGWWDLRGAVEWWGPGEAWLAPDGAVWHFSEQGPMRRPGGPLPAEGKPLGFYGPHFVTWTDRGLNVYGMSGDLLYCVPLDSPPLALAGDGENLVTVGSGQLRLWRQGERLAMIANQGWDRVLLQPALDLVLAWNREGQSVALLGLPALEPLGTLACLPAVQVWPLELAVTIGGEGVQQWTINTKNPVEVRLLEVPSPPEDSPRARRGEEFTLLRPLGGFSEGPGRLSPDGLYWVGETQVRELLTGRCLPRPPGRAFVGSEHRLAVESDGVLRVLRNGQPLARLETRRLCSVVFGEDWIWTAQADPQRTVIRCWSESGQLVRERELPGQFKSWQSASGRWLVNTYSQSHFLRADSLEELWRQPVMGTVALSPDGLWLATGTDHPHQTRAILLEADSGEQAHVLEDNREGVNALVFSPDQRYLALGLGGNQMFRVWNLQTRNASRVVESGFVGCLRFAPEGAPLFLGTGMNQLVCWAPVGAGVRGAANVGRNGVEEMRFDRAGNVWVVDGQHNVHGFQRASHRPPQSDLAAFVASLPHRPPPDFRMGIDLTVDVDRWLDGERDYWKFAAGG